MSGKLVKAYIKIVIDHDEKTINFPIVFFKDQPTLEAYAASKNIALELLNSLYSDETIQYYNEDKLVNIDSIIQELHLKLGVLEESENSIENLIQRIVVKSKLHDISPDVENALSLRGNLMGINILIKKIKFNKLSKNDNNQLKSLKLKLTSYLERETPIRNFNTHINEFEEASLYKYTNNRLSLTNFTLPNKTNFQGFINTEFTLGTRSDSNKRLPIKLWDSEHNKFDNIQPFNHQKFVSDYLSEETPYRGLLLYHGLGSGKSGASILIGEGFSDRKVVVLLPASLRRNYVEEIRTFGEVAYKKNFHWKFVELGETASINESRFQDFFRTKGVQDDLYLQLRNEVSIGSGSSKKQGLWLVDYNKEPNYSILSDAEHKSLDKQINLMFGYKYKFCNYNAGKYTITKILEQLVPNYSVIFQRLVGSVSPRDVKQKHVDLILNHIYNADNNVPNPFDDKVVIVDEIHNLTSGMIGGGYNSPRIYELIMRSKNSKLVFLSGTPVINFPYELGLMLNMLRGFIRVIEFNVSKRDGITNIIELENLLEKYPYVDRYTVKSGTVHITRTPNGFVNNYDESGTKIGVTKELESDDMISTFSNDELILNLRGYLLENNYRIDSHAKLSMMTIFPDILDKTDTSKIMVANSKFKESSEKLFNETYITDDAGDIKNQISLKNRILGLVSFYNEVSSDYGEEPIFPERIDADPEDVEVIMSNYQFLEYIEYRQIEREKEEMATKMRRSSSGGEALDNISKLFKVYTRQRGIFVFPPGIERPMPPKKDKLSFSSASKREEITNAITEIITKGDRVSAKIQAYVESLPGDEQESAEVVLGSLFRKEFGDISELFEELDTYDWGDQTTIESLEGLSDVFDVDERTYNDKLLDAVNSLTEENLTINDSPYNLEALSPKYFKMLHNTLNSNGKSFAYSQFRAVEGVEIFSRVLQANGYTRIELSDDNLSEKVTMENSTLEIGKRVRVKRGEDGHKDDTGLSKSYMIEDIDGDILTLSDWDGDEIKKDDVDLCKFALWTGSESVEARQTILDIYNATNNLFGNKCQMLMTTQSGAEGISLTAVRQVHIMEPYWNNVRADQVIGRARRTNSHNELPVAMRNVKVYKYVIKYSKEQLEEPDRFIENSEELVYDYLRNRKESIIQQVVEQEGDDIDEEEKMRIAKLTYNSELLSYRQGIIHADDKITSDEVLVNISQKKERILKKFLHLFKEVAVDCQFNRMENIRSDPELESMSCYDTPISDSGNYVYSIDNQDVLESTQTDRLDETREVVMKYFTIPIKYKDSSVKILVIIPGNLESYRDVEENTPIYDYYSFKGINPSTKLSHRSKYVIGNIVVKGSKKSFDLDHKKYTPDVYNTIESCIKELGEMPSAVDNASEYNKYISSITSCYNKKIGIEVDELDEDIVDDNNWTCDICDTVNPNAIDMCSNCGFDRED